LGTGSKIAERVRTGAVSGGATVRTGWRVAASAAGASVVAVAAPVIAAGLIAWRMVYNRPKEKLRERRSGLPWALLLIFDLFYFHDTKKGLHRGAPLGSVAGEKQSQKQYNFPCDMSLGRNSHRNSTISQVNVAGEKQSKKQYDFPGILSITSKFYQSRGSRWVFVRRRHLAFRVPQRSTRKTAG